MSPLVPVVLASALLFTPAGVNGADLVVWSFKRS
jgi:hypothetical protein